MDPAGSTSLPLDKECARLTAGTSLRHRGVKLTD